MTDMLVKLYALPNAEKLRNGLERQRITIRRAMAYENSMIIQWIADVFSTQWADECQMAFCQHPVSCTIAVSTSTICGFCCSDCTFLGFMGPVGVDPDFRGRGIGKALVLTTLEEMRCKGYAYAIVGDAGYPEFFQNITGAEYIANSKPGPYPERLNTDRFGK
jgi:GNAT superfamily N-acetyltransferase